MTRQYAVTIQASTTEVKPRVMAERLCELLDRPVDQLEEAITGGVMVLENGLKYREAIEIQKELGRRRIPARICAEEEVQGEKTWLRRGEEEEIRDGQEVGDEAWQAVGEWEEVELDLDEVVSQKPAPAEEEPGEKSAWAELFPDLSEPTSSKGGQEEEDFFSELEGFDDPVGGLLDEFSSPVVEDVEEIGTWEGADSLDEGGEQLPLLGAAQAVVASPAVSSAVEGSGGFDASVIRQAFVDSEEERPPFKPRSYDPRPPHIPALAAILSFIAPGAGQIFNGEEEKAQRYGMSFFLVVPWVLSIVQAARYGEKVRTYYAPRPEQGAGKRALVYGLKWWLSVAVVAVVVTSMYGQLEEHLEQRESSRQALVLQEMLHYANDAVEDGVEDGAGAAEVAAAEWEARQEEERAAEPSMDPEERARRLFIVGYHYCAGRNYEMCQQMMSRVTSLVPGNRDAFRLQAWASMQSRAARADREPIPEVSGEVPTLNEFEVQLATEGASLEEVDEGFEQWWDDRSRRDATEEGGQGREYGEWWDEWLEREGNAQDDEGAQD